MPVATRRRCPHFGRVDTADWPSTSGDIFRSLPASRKSLSRHTFRSTSLAREALLSMSTAPPGSPPAWLRAPGLWWCEHRNGRCGSRGRRRWASKQSRKQAKGPAKPDTGEANKPARNYQCAPRRSVSQARSRVRSKPDQFSSCAGGCGSRRSFRKHRTIEEHHAAAGASGFTI